MSTEQLPIISADECVQAFYEKCRRQGESHNMAKICAERRGPGLNTDTTFLANRGNPFGSDEVYAKRAVATSKSHGVTPAGKTYIGG